MNRFYYLVLLVILTIFIASENQAATLRISCGAVGMELETCKKGIEAWEKKTGHKVELVQTPNSPTERLAIYQQMLASGSDDVDVFQIDVIWPGLLANHLLDLKSNIDKAITEKFFTAMVDNNTVKDRLVALPWFTDAGILFYRKDLLEKHDKPVPQTWQELTETAKFIQAEERKAGRPQFWGYVFQAKAYEGLTCNALEWIDSYKGGTIIQDNGVVSLSNGSAVEALQMAASWIGTITPQGVLNYAEEDSRGVFQSGNALFMRNWPYAWALGNAPDSPIKDKIGVAALPKGGDQGKHSGTLGGWQLAVSKYSKHPKEAVDLIVFLTGEEEQKRRAITAALNPTIPSLYEDPEVIKANPFMAQLKETFMNAVARPSKLAGQNYNRLSTEFANTVHRILSGQTDALAKLKTLEKVLGRITKAEDKKEKTEEK